MICWASIYKQEFKNSCLIMESGVKDVMLLISTGLLSFYLAKCEEIMTDNACTHAVAISSKLT